MPGLLICDRIKAGKCGKEAVMKNRQPYRFLSIMLAIFMIVLTVAACSGSKPAQETSAGVSAPESSASEEASSETDASQAQVQEVSGESPESTDGAKAENESESESAEAQTSLIEAPQISAEEFPVTDGSTATLPLSWMLYRLCTGKDQQAAEDAMHFTKTNNAYLRLMDKDADLVIAYEPGPNAKEDPRFDDLILKPIGLDALIFICNSGNPVESLTTEEIRDIYTGNIKSWKDVGGEDTEIIAFQREVNSGSQTLMENLMMKGTPMADAPQEYRPSEMGDLIEYVATYANTKNALGYSVYFYAQNMYTRPNLRFMAVDGVMPSNDTIRSGEYKYTNPFYVAIRKDEPGNSRAHELFDWLTTDDGQSLVDEMGYVSSVKGSKSLPDGLKAKVSINGGGLEENTHRLAVNGKVYDGTAGVVFLDTDMQYLGREDSIRIRDNDEFALIRGSVFPASKPLYNTDPGKENNGEEYYSNIKIGLYDVDLGDWAAEPVYDFCYTECPDGDHALFYLGIWQEAYDEEGNYIGDDIESEVELFDENGNKVRTMKYRGWDGLRALIGNTLRQVHTDPKYSEDGNIAIYQFGGNTRFISSFGDGEETVLEVNGEVFAKATDGYAFPDQSDNTSEDELPYLWHVVHLYDSGYDEERGYYYDDAGQYVINEKGEVVYTLIGREEESIRLSDRYFVIINNYETGKYVIRDMTGGEVTSWIEPEDYEYADWWG